MVTSKPRKQRLALYSAPLHLRHRFLSAPLSRELKEKYKTRALPLRKGDRVRVLRGDFKKLEGEVVGIDSKRRSLYVEGASITKADGTQVPRPIRPSNVMLLKLAEDKERMQALERVAKSG
ncbi:MAG: 50S ribosomal protein L24 [Candidatus Hodarchaeaceae archaeon]|nr:50S ribosomal protein L24 [Candidatus Hodarchaeaceae archaeon]